MIIILSQNHILPSIKVILGQRLQPPPHNTTTTTNSNNTAGATPNTSASSLDTNLKRTYKFDQIYGSQADQNLIYSQIAHPLLLDFLRGINVTVLAYGQTGTGKTYTMSGMDNNNKLDENSDIAGIIPRLLGELFQNLSSNATSKNDYMVKISYLEIYNEELIDLLATIIAIIENYEFMKNQC